MPPPRIKLPAADTAAGGSQMEYMAQRVLGFYDEYVCCKASLTHQHLLFHFNSHLVGHINGSPQINIDFWRLDTDDLVSRRIPT